MEEDRFHRAARDGYLDLLHEASKRDLNSQDEDGMTPTLWAAHEGHLDALRLIAGRGGNPDKCDNFGNAALHCAAAKGHLNCVSFLVNFGANLWAMDNDFHTCKDLAAIRNRDEILRYLDTVIGKQEALNKKVVRALKDKAVKEAEKRVKEYDKMQKKQDKKAEKYEQQLQKRETTRGTTGHDEDDAATPAVAPPTKSRRGFIGTVSRATGNLMGLHKQQPTTPPATGNQAPSFSDHTNYNRNKNLPGGVNRRLQQNRNSKFQEENFTVSENKNGTVSRKSLRGLKRDDDIMFVQNYDTVEEDGDGSVEPSRRGKLADLEFRQTGASAAAEQSLFDRPGFGNVAFRSMAPNLNRLGEEPTRGQEDSIGSAGSLTGKDEHYEPAWEEQDLPSDDDAEETDPETSAMHLFLTSAGLQEFIPIFVQEKVDLASLELLSESDLIELGVPLGPRKKLQKALNDRKASIEEPGEMADTPL